MAINYPTSLDDGTSMPDPTDYDDLRTTGIIHADVEKRQNDAIKAIEAKVGIDASAVTTSLDYRTRALEANAAKAKFIGTADKDVTNTTTETTMIPTGVGAMPNGNTLVAGKTWRVLIQGKWSLATGALTVRVKIGSTTILTLAVDPLAETDALMEVEATLTCRSVGASGTVAAVGKFLWNDQNANFIGDPRLLGMHKAFTSSTATVDTTASGLLDVTAQWASADAGNLLRTLVCVVEEMHI